MISNTYKVASTEVLERLIADSPAETFVQQLLLYIGTSGLTNHQDTLLREIATRAAMVHLMATKPEPEEGGEADDR